MVRFSSIFGALVLAGLCGGGVAFAQSEGDGIRDFASPGGGEIIAGPLGRQDSPSAAMGVLLRRVHEEFGRPPAITEAAENPAGNSIALFFTIEREGVPYTGMATVEDTPGAEAGGAAMIDVTQRFATSIGGMLAQLKSLTDAPADASAPAPPEPLLHREFSDGTGSVDVPEDWTLTNASGGSASVVGPTGEVVSYNLAANAIDPHYPAARNYLANPIFLKMELPRTAILSYLGDPAQAWTSVFRQLAQQNARPAPSFEVQSVTPLATYSASRLEEVAGVGTIPGIKGKRDDEPGSFVAYVQVSTPNTMGQWAMYSTFVFVPTREMSRLGPTAAAILGSVRINFAAVAAQSQAIREMFEKKFEDMMASARAADAARQEQTDRFLARDRETQEGMHRQAVAWVNYLLGRAVVVNDSSGEHSTIDADLTDVLVKNDPNYHKAAPSELLKGVDY
jgi:hypothetical protein